MAKESANGLARGFVRVRTLSLEDWRQLAIAVKELALARVRHAAWPVARILSDLESPSPRTPSQNVSADLARLSWAIAAAAHHVPWRADCLLQAMAAHRWLRRRGVSTDFFLGVRKDDQGDLHAHAWLRCGDVTVTGPGHESFSAIIAAADRRKEVV